ncbi:3-oxoadipate enol-lactonase [Trinickia diaoshuihuensis]|uniref:3-oxoadipate enol-lactonase n=1 Tax=Trinickia diaoshuihuensis TaxID=2292265 RepID=UPI000E260EAA|nr:3-oxoadipate enol-lactonase [Trinickia diaoshuihuensis]
MTTLHHELSGPADAPVIVLSNSLGTTLDMWNPQIDALQAKFRVLRYDARGHGRSAVPPGSYTIEALGRDVIDLLDSLDIERAHFVGISMGGLTGQWLGVHAGTRIDKLVVSNTAARIGTREGWRARAELVRRQGLAEVADGAAGRWFTPRFIAAQPSTVETLTARLRSLSPEGYAACCEALGDADLREDIARIACPTLVVAGAHDPVTTVDDARFIAERVVGARVAELEASHLSNIEAADAFTDAVLRFLAE